MPKSKAKDSVVIDYLRFTIPIEYTRHHRPFISQKLAELYLVDLAELPETLLSHIVHVMKLDVRKNDSIPQEINTHGYNNYDYCKTINDIRFMYVDTTPVFNEGSSWYGVTEEIKRQNHNRTNPYVTIERNAQMGVCVELTGSVLRRYEAWLKYFNLDLHDVIKALTDEFRIVKFTRIDLARDIKKRMQGVSPLAFYRQCVQGLVASKSRKWTYIDSGDLDLNSSGSTLSVGTRSSEFYMRNYDKAREQYYQHGVTTIDLKKDFWVRWEFELKSNLANTIGHKFADAPDMYSIYKIYLDILYAKFWVYPSDKQIKKGNYTNVDKMIGHGTKRHARKTKMANWFYDFCQPETRDRVVVSRPSRNKSGVELVKNYNNGSIFEKLYTHTSHGGSGIKVLANWIVRGKFKKNDINYPALKSKLENSQYNPDVIDSQFTEAEALKIILNADKNVPFDYFDMKNDKMLNEAWT